MYDIVAVGELLIDFATQSTDGEGYPTMAAHPGGAPANFLAAATACGAKTALLGKVGKDTFGDLLIGSLQKAGIETQGIVQADDVFTTLAFVTFDAAGDRSFAFARKPGADTQLASAELDTGLLNEARALHFGSLSLTHEPARTATQKAVELAKGQGKLITFDPNLRPPLWADLQEAKTQMLWGLAQADVVKISEEEVEFLFGCGPEEGAQKLLQEYGVQLALVTLGKAGCWFANQKGSGLVPGFAVNTIDTTGAGDIFGGTAAALLLKEAAAPGQLTPEAVTRVLRYACGAAGLSTTRPGGISSVPACEEVTAFLAAQA